MNEMNLFTIAPVSLSYQNMFNMFTSGLTK